MKENFFGPCICPRECDCENPEPEHGVALVSNECPEHNIDQQPNPDCPAGIHWWDDGYYNHTPDLFAEEQTA